MIFDIRIVCIGRTGKPATPASGFSLIELMTVLVIVAILAAVAIPFYGRYAHRAHRVDGQTLLMHIADAQERFYATNNHYGTLTDLGYAEPVISEKKYYSATSKMLADPAGNSSQAYIAAVTPVGTQANDLCGALTISNTGAKTPPPSSEAANANGSCW